MLVFLLDYLRFSKLLKLYHTERRILSNLLKCKQSSRKTSIVCRKLQKIFVRYIRIFQFYQISCMSINYDIEFVVIDSINKFIKLKN